MNKELTAFITKKLPVFFTTNIGILILGFILTTICGGVINQIHTRTTWNREKRFELLKGELVRHEELLSDLTTVIGERVFRLQRVVWLLDPAATPAPETWWRLNDDAQKELKARWDIYYETVAKWNVRYRNYAIKIRIQAGQKMAEQFILPDDKRGAQKAKSGTLCGVIEDTHKTVADLRTKAMLTSQVDGKEHELAQQKVYHLYDEVDKFVTKLYETLRDKEQSDDPVATSSPSPAR
jgi:hypothetical protein